jgi:Uncharacterised nucleotidyltransferase
MTALRVQPFDVVGRVLSQRLHASVASARLRAMVGSHGINWERVVGLASVELVLPALAAALEDFDLLGSLDRELGAFLEAVHAANRERNDELRGELAAAVGVLNQIGIEPVLLKGSLRLLDGLYPDDGWRMLQDLDLLIPEASWVEASRAFASAGYASVGSGGEIRRRDGACQIDLHTELFGSPRHFPLLRALDVLKTSRPLAFGDGRVRVPSVEHQLVHLIGHSQIRHLGHAFGRIGLRHRLEAAALARWGRERIDWPAVFRRFVTAGYRRPLLAFVLSLNDDGWCAIPVLGRPDRLTRLQQRRIALQARSATFAYFGARIGCWLSAFWNQFEVSDGGQRRAVSNVKRLIHERGAIRRMVSAFGARQRHLLHVLPYLGWFMAQ